MRSQKNNLLWQIIKVIIVLVIFIGGYTSILNWLYGRDLFVDSNLLQGRTVFCTENNPLAVETYCRLLRSGASPTDDEDNADLIVSLKKEILYISDNKGNNLINLPVGAKYIANTNKIYLNILNQTIEEIATKKTK